VRSTEDGLRGLQLIANGSRRPFGVGTVHASLRTRRAVKTNCGVLKLGSHKLGH
jgi:hypothetical protein